MLTPKDIHDVQFPRVLKGYSPKEVDAFLRKIVVEYEGILQENDDLQAQIRVLEEKVYEAAALQKGIRDALAKANELVERRRLEAEEEAERIIQRARHAAQIEEEHARRIREFGAGVKRRLRSLLMTNISLLDDEDQPAQPPRRSESELSHPSYSTEPDRDYASPDYRQRERHIAAEAEMEETRVFTLPPGMRDPAEVDGRSESRKTLATVEEAYGEAAASRELDERPHEDDYEDGYEAYDADNDGPYDEEQVLKARWARRLRRNRDGEADNTDEID